MDIQLHYTEQGEGTPLILLHGNGEDGSYFSNQIHYFSKQYRVIAIDTRGHGQSPRGTAPFTIRQFADDLHEFMESQSIGKAHILGFSDGGNIAIAFALKYPDQVRRLILNGANLNTKGVKCSVQLPIEIGYRMASLFAARSQNARKNVEILSLMVKEPNFTPDQLHTITAKTLVIAGTNDMIKEDHTRLICDSLPNAELAIIPGTHFIASKNPAEFNKMIDVFLNSD